MKNRFKKYTVLFSVLLASVGSAAACSFGTEFEDIRYIVLNPNLANNKAWWSYFYTSHLHYMDGGVWSNEDEMQIAAEWKRKFNLKSTPEQIEAYLFENPSDTETKTNPFHAELRNLPRLAEYFAFVADCGSVVFQPDPWESIHTDSVAAVRGDLLLQGLARTRKQIDPFWQKKYAFQTLRLAYYQNEYEVFNRLYNTYFGFGREKTPLDWWATHYKSMVLEKTDADSANYLHALVFSHSSNKMFVSRQWFSSRNFDRLIRLARNDSDLADLYVLKAMINPGKVLDDIREVVRLNLDHPLLPLLLIRETNKLEDWIGTYQYNRQTAWGDATRKLGNDYYYLRAFYKQVQSMRPPSQNADWFYLISANLALMNQDASNARKYLALATSVDPQIQYQKKVLGIMLDVITEDITSPQTANKIGEALYFLLENSEQQFEARKISYSLMKFLEHQFKAKGANHLAGLMDYMAEEKFCNSCRLNSMEYSIVDYFNRFGTPADVEKVLALSDKKDKTKLDEFLLMPYPNTNYFKELLGTLYLREGNVQKARGVYAQLPQTFWDNFDNLVYLDEDPFVIDDRWYGGMHPFYNKFQVAEQLLQLEERAKSHPEAYIRLGHAWYNFSGYGNSWFMLEYYQNEDDINYSVENMPDHNPQILKRSMAYYQKALALLTSPEDRAEAAYGMAMVCRAQGNATEFIRVASDYEKYDTTAFYRNAMCETTLQLRDEKNRAELIKNWSGNSGE